MKKCLFLFLITCHSISHAESAPASIKEEATEIREQTSEQTTEASLLAELPETYKGLPVIKATDNEKLKSVLKKRIVVVGKLLNVLKHKKSNRIFWDFNDTRTGLMGFTSPPFDQHFSGIELNKTYKNQTVMIKGVLEPFRKRFQLVILHPKDITILKDGFPTEE